MENSQKAIIIGVSLFLTIFVISAILLITNFSIGSAKNSRKQLSSVDSYLQEQLLREYHNNKLITADDVITAINQYVGPLDNKIAVIKDGEVYLIHPNLFSQEYSQGGFHQVEPNTKEGLIALVDLSKYYYANYFCFDDSGYICLLFFDVAP